VLRLVTPIGTPGLTMANWYRGPSLVIDRTDGGELVVRFADETSFVVSADGRSIALIAAPPAYTRDDLAAYALGPVIAIALHLQGAVLLHAASVVLRGKAVVFAGEGGSGKSTIAALLHGQGCAVLADDVTEIAGAGPYRALASLPAVRLWPDVIHALFGEAAVFPDRAPSWEKKMVAIEAAPPAEIAAVLFLDLREANPRLERLSSRDAWRRLIANVYTAKLPGDAMMERIFEVTSALAGAMPMYAFAPPPLENAERLGAFLERELEALLR
jgi:predicted ATPase